MGSTRYLLLAAVLLMQSEIGVAARPCPVEQSNPNRVVYHEINKLDKDDLAHGRVETEKMLHDLPEMRQWLRNGCPLYDFAVKQYAGEGLGWWLYWKVSNSKPGDPSYSEASHLYPLPTRRGLISIAKTCKSPKSEKAASYWSSFVFESFNIRSSPRQLEILCDAEDGKITREKCIRRRAELEFEAERKTETLYRTTIRPWAQKFKIATHPYYWYVYTPNTLKAWWSQYKDRNGYPWKYYGSDYDKMIASQKKHGQLPAKKRAPQ